MTEHLVRLGHRRIGYLRGPAANVLEHDRYAGYCDALGAARTAARPAPGAARRLLHLPPARRRRAAIWRCRHLPDAVFACNDAMAMGLIRGFTAAGLAVPDDISVAGFDDIEFAAAYIPALTTVHQSRRDIGARAAAMLIDLIGADSPPAARFACPPRSSCATARARCEWHARSLITGIPLVNFGLAPSAFLPRDDTGSRSALCDLPTGRRGKFAIAPGSTATPAYQVANVSIGARRAARHQGATAKHIVLLRRPWRASPPRADGAGGSRCASVRNPSIG